MAGTKAGWTPQRRAAQATRMRALMADPEFMERRAAKIAASPKIAAARRENARRISSDPAVRAKWRAWRATPEGQAALVRGGLASIEKRRNDPDTRMHHKLQSALSGQRKDKRAAASRALKKRWQEPDFILRQIAKAIRIGCDPETHRKAWETRRAGKVPKTHRRRYRELRDLIGANAAMAVVKREAAMMRVNR